MNLFGFETRRSDQSVMLNGLTAGGVLIDILQVKAFTKGSKNYPIAASSAAITTRIVSGGGPTFTPTFLGDTIALQWDYSVSRPQYDTTVFVFAQDLSRNDLYGIRVKNDANEVLADQGYPSPQYLGKMTLGATPTVAYKTPDGYTAIVHTTSVSDLRAGANKMVLMSLPDSGTADTWYTLRKEYILASEGAVAVSIVVYTKASTYAIPSLHVYALDSPVPSGATYGMRVYTATQQLTFDSGAECLPGRTALSVTYPDYGASSPTNTYTLGFSSSFPAVSMPFYSYSQMEGTGRAVDRFTSAAKRVGLQVTATCLFDYKTTSSYDGNNHTDHDTSAIGNPSGRYCATADVTFQNPSTTTLNVPTTFASPPSITIQPQDPIGDVNVPFTLSLTAGGTGPFTYQWYHSDVAIPGATGSSYQFTPTTADNQTTYYCIVRSAMGWVRSRNATYYYDTATDPVITGYTYPSGQVTPNTSVRVGFTASGSPAPYCELLLNGTVVATGSGSAYYTFTTSSSATSYTFDCRATTTGQTLTHVNDGNYFTVTVSSANAVKITASPQNKSVTAGAQVSFSCSVSGDLPIRWTWFKRGQGIAGPYDTNSRTDTLTFTAAIGDNGAGIYCVAGNYPLSEGSTYTAQSATATLSVSNPAPVTPKPVFSQQPGDAYVTEPSPSSFSCTASPATRYQWYRNGVAVSGATGSGIYIGSTSASADDGAQYSVTAYNDDANGTASQASSPAYLHVAAAAQPSTYRAYVNPPPYTVTDTGTVSWAASGNSTDSGGWTDNSPGDPSLYDIRATSGTGSPSGSAYDTWYNMASGASWYVFATSTAKVKTISFTFQIRLRSSGGIVSSGTVQLTSTWSIAQ